MNDTELMKTPIDFAKQEYLKYKEGWLNNPDSPADMIRVTSSLRSYIGLLEDRIRKSESFLRRKSVDMLDYEYSIELHRPTVRSALQVETCSESTLASIERFVDLLEDYIHVLPDPAAEIAE